jgi:7-cyano-7-deazaguanine reductase
MSQLKHTPLGKQAVYKDQYDPSLLFPIPRIDKRREIGIQAETPFHGVDIWYGYELSWLNQKGKPETALAVFTYPCDSSHLIESKSFKLYLNSFNQTRFSSREEVSRTLVKDLSQAAGKPVEVAFPERLPLDTFKGICLDSQDIEVETYQVNPSLLGCEEEEEVEERLYSNLLKSNCLVTGQPDWGSVAIHYQGPRIDHAGLLKYIISFRQHLEFHEQCIERMFVDLLRECRCKKLTVFGKYTRRGGLDINPFRSNFEQAPPHFRTDRQ